MGKVVSDEEYYFFEENIGSGSFYWFFIMKITSHNKTFEWRLRLVEWHYAQAALLGTALQYGHKIYTRGMLFSAPNKVE